MTDLLDLGDERFVSLTTYRRSGEGVATPVWVARVDDRLVVTTSPTAGKTKRVRNDPRVTLRPCDRRGRVADGAPTVEARADVLTGAAECARPLAALRAEYGAEWFLVQAMLLAERALRRGPGERVILELTGR